MSEKIDRSSQTDLGDDLLQSDTPKNIGLDKPINDLEGDLQSARILIDEGLLEDAKKRLRKILLQYSDSAAAKTLLDKIHDLELLHLFDSPRRPGYLENFTEESESFVDEGIVQEMLKDLDKNLGLPAYSLQDQLKIHDEINKTYKNLEDSDRMDLGIAFFEMNLIDLALKQFEMLTLTNSSIVNTALHATCLIQLDRHTEATILLESKIRKIPIENDSLPGGAIELIYLLGLSYQKSKMYLVATQWFTEVYRIDPHYRDIRARLTNIRSDIGINE